MTLPRYRCLPQVADLRLRVWGYDQRELLNNAILGCLRLALGKAPHGPASAKRCIVPWPRDRADRLVRIVNEALFLLYTHRLVVVAVESAGGSVTLAVRPLAAHESPQLEIKAATFHGLRPTRCRRGWRADLVLDT